MGGRRPPPGLREPALVDHHRLGGRSAGQDPAEAGAVLDPLYVRSYHLGLRVVGEVFQEVALIDIAGIAMADDLAETESPDRSAADDIGGVAAALADEADRAGFLGIVEAEADLGRRAVEPHAIGAEQAHAAAFGDLHDPVLKRDALRIAGLGKAGAEELHQLDTSVPALLNQVGAVPCRYGADDVINGAVNLSQGAIDLHSLRLAALGIDGVDLAGVAELNERIDVVLIDPPVDRVSGRAHQRDRLGMEDVLQCR